MRVAIVHDYLTQFGGAERVLLALTELFPHAPVFTLVHDTTMRGVSLDAKRIKTSFLQRVPFARSHHRYFPMLMPLAIEQFDFREYDIVFSATHSFGKGIITAPHTMHISYCFTPTRYVWDDCHRYVREFTSNRLLQKVAPWGLSYIRLWDYCASQRVDAYLTLSRYVAQRIKKYYHREAIVIPPPVDVAAYTPTAQAGEEGYYLVVSRLVPYKRIDVAIDACEKLGRRLVIVGTGPEEPLLRERAGKFTSFAGFVSEDRLPIFYAGARALLFPQEEDFGITPLEAAAAGRPTIAYRAGGALETVEEHVTGIFFDRQQPAELAKAILRSEAQSWDAATIRHHAEKFDRRRFLRDLKEAVHSQWMAYSTHHRARV